MILVARTGSACWSDHVRALAYKSWHVAPLSRQRPAAAPACQGHSQLPDAACIMAKLLLQAPMRGGSRESSRATSPRCPDWNIGDAINDYPHAADDHEDLMELPSMSPRIHSGLARAPCCWNCLGDPGVERPLVNLYLRTRTPQARKDA